MVVLRDRPVVAFNQWLADALRVCGESGRGLQIVTPVTSRLSLPLKLVLTGPGSLWVISDGGGYYDGLTGRPLRWDGAAFSPVPEARDYAPGYTTRSSEPIGAQLTLTFRVRHGAGELLGGAVGHLCHSFTGHPPLGWGTAEPAANLWNLDEMNGLFRQRSPRATWLAVIGPAAEAGPGAGMGDNGAPPVGQRRTMVGTLLLSSSQGGVEEAGTLVFGFSAADPPPVSTLSTLVGSVAAEHRLASLFAQLSPGRADLTTEPRWMGAPAPIGMAVGAETGVGSVPSDVPGRPIGDPRSPAMWFDLGDGRSAEGWRRYEQLMRHLRAPA
ncbi:hypothetical protein HKK74_09345 [Actinomadura alba]|uniref:Uncharacterized protein n=2 Tax=Actinomadura alba TaxID=406431 RepID=A0ABR7LMG8_9ACTN|nr:hypothetical protein [Actinomadura alba]